jgi:hypothetical protein
MQDLLPKSVSLGLFALALCSCGGPQAPPNMPPPEYEEAPAAPSPAPLPPVAVDAGLG